MLIDLQEISSRESERVEWKENVADIRDVVATICALANDFANLGGGYVVCGVKEERDGSGFQKMLLTGLASERRKEVEGKALAWCQERVDPPLSPIVEELPAADPARRVLVFIVPASPLAHSLRARGEDSPTFYIRQGRNTIAARNGLFRDLMTMKGALEPWDRRPCRDATSDDIDLIALREYLKRMGVWSDSRPIESYLSPRDAVSSFVPPLLAKESLTGALRPRNFALLLFAKDAPPYIPGAYATVSFYGGIDRSEDVSRRVEITGPLPRQVEETIRALDSELQTVLDKRTSDPNQQKYPSRAIQEAVTNAFAHRDYEMA